MSAIDWILLFAGGLFVSWIIALAIIAWKRMKDMFNDK